ncbi:MAG TPA: tetratricopeptide repeat protein [Actinocrinis sp.]|uniref:tetratricopeptide repeat protein n=1 Tax=Actinocrinis sp. TaxID=1920516 RepID=UPI002D628C47|nr:tetratricopeptide repeat protein [Actinocrinis sp.]HZU55969.1 tetratricopeptide repeat protein [Actinocrinis sp.]
MAEGAQQWHGDAADERWAGPGEPLDDSALSGEVNDWYQRGIQMLDSGNPAAATQLLVRAADRVPRSRSVLEALARAQFDAEQYEEAAQVFRTLAESNPDDDYAQFGWGLAAARLGDYELAVEHLALAAAMRPDVRYYTQALRGARATVRSRSGAGKQGRA